MRSMLITSLLLALLLLSACDLHHYEGTGEDGVTGTQGVKMDFIPGTTPLRIMEDEPYNIQLRIENKGALDIEEGYLDYSFDRQLFDFQNREDVQDFALQGDDGAFRGEDRVKEIRMHSKTIPMQDVTQTTTGIKINACYEYGTRFEGTMCIDTDLRSDSSDKPCIMSPVSGDRGQGAPVVVHRVEPRGSMGSAGANINFDIYIRNAGRGTVISPGSAERLCRSEISSEDFGLIDLSEIIVSKYRLSEGDIRCESHTDSPNQFDLRHQRDYISCRISDEIPADLGTFTTPITIRLDYGYLQSLEHRVDIVAR